MQNNYSWYSPKGDLDSQDAVHQLLAYGTLEEINEAKKRIGLDKLRAVFINYPKKIYHPAALHFIKKFILNITGTINNDRYLKNTPRNLG